MRRGALTTLPPNTSTMDWCPRHTPNTGTWPANARIMSIDTPASYGVPGPGEMHRWGGANARAQHHERLHQVVGERVVVVDQQQTDAHKPSEASLSARAIAPDFATTSS